MYRILIQEPGGLNRKTMIMIDDVDRDDVFSPLRLTRPAVASVKRQTAGGLAHGALSETLSRGGFRAACREASPQFALYRERGRHYYPPRSGVIDEPEAVNR